MAKAAFAYNNSFLVRSSKNGLARQDLDVAVCIAIRDGPAVRGEGKLALLIRNFLRLGPVFQIR